MSKNKSCCSNVQRYPNEVNFVDQYKPLSYTEQAIKANAKKLSNARKDTVLQPICEFVDDKPNEKPFGLVNISKIEKARIYEMEGLNGFQILNKIQADKYALSRVKLKQYKEANSVPPNPLLIHEKK